MDEPISAIRLKGRKLFSAEVTEIRSGDDLVVLVDIGVDQLYKKVRVRLEGVDTPDAFRESGDTEAGRVREEVRQMVRHKQCWVEVCALGKGGWKVILYAEGDGDPINVNEFLKAKGYVFKREPREASVS